MSSVLKWQIFPLNSFSVTLWGWAPWEQWGQHGSGQPEELHLLLQAGQSRLSTTSHSHGDVMSLEHPEPTRPVWPGMQSSYQAVSTTVHPQGGNRSWLWCGETYRPSLFPKTTSQLQYTQVLALPQNNVQENTDRVYNDVFKGLSALFSWHNHPLAALTCSFPLCSCRQWSLQYRSKPLES